MLTQRLYKISASLVVTALLMAACASPTAAPPTQPAATDVPVVENTAAPAATDAPDATAAPAATTAPAGPGECPASTLADMAGVPAGAYPQQYELAEFETLANCEMTFSSRESFDERLEDTNAVAFPLPPVEERLPEEPLVVQPYEAIGAYGGRLRFASVAPEAGNSEFLSARHTNLVRFNDDLQTIVPNVAKDYEWNADFTELTMTLRKGHKWSDGEPFTSADVDFWFNDIILNPDLRGSVSTQWIYGGEPMAVEAVDEVTVKFSFAAPAPGFLILAATTYIQMYEPKHFLMDKHLKYNPDADAAGIAAGYEGWVQHFASWQNDWQDAVHHLTDVGQMPPKLESHVLVVETPEFQLFAANPYYYKVDTTGQQLPYTDEQHQSYAPDPELITLKVINGELEEKAQGLLIGDLPVYQANQDNGNYDIQMPPGAGSGYLYAFNCTSKDPVLAEIFSNPKWNQAMSLALNRDEINQTINFGLSEPIQALPVHPSVSFAKPEWFTTLIEYDPDQSNALLDEIGLSTGADGFRVRPDGQPLVVQLVYAPQWGDVAMHVLAKEYWEAVGVKVELREVSSEAYRTMASNNDHDVATTNSGLTTEAPLYSNPFRLYPPFGDAALEPICGGPWAEWRATNGASGTEPPDDVKTLWDLTDEWKSTPPTDPRYAELGQQIVEIHREHMWLIGTVTSTPAITIVSRALGNVPEWKINAFEYYRMYPQRTDQWFFTELPAASN